MDDPWWDTACMGLSSPGQTLYVHEQSLWARSLYYAMYIAGMAYMGSDRYIPIYPPTHLNPYHGLGPTYRPRACGRLYTRARA